MRRIRLNPKTDAFNWSLNLRGTGPSPEAQVDHEEERFPPRTCGDDGGIHAGRTACYLDVLCLGKDPSLSAQDDHIR